MEFFNYLEKYDYEQLIFCQDKESGLKAIIAIHDTTLGPALGGTRMWMYDNEREAIEDALRLARGMTYKAAAAGLNLGGGKAVIIGDPLKNKSEGLFRSFGRFIQSLNGRYVTAIDVGTTEEDMHYIFEETNYVTCLSPSFGGSGNPSPITAFGVFLGMKATAKEAWGNDSLSGKKIAVQGLGNVAYHLCRYLFEEGAHLIVTDINKAIIKRAVDEFGAEMINADEIYAVDCDIFSPNALGAVINDQTISQLKARVIAGSANNVLKEERHGDMLHDLGFYYAPDYIINAGGLINVADELFTYNKERVMEKVKGIYQSTTKVFEISKRNNIPTYKAADRLVEERINLLKNTKSTFLRNEKSIFK